MSRNSCTALSTGRKCSLVAAGVLLLLAPIGFGVLHGQSAASTKVYTWTPDMPKYDVASIKPASPDDGGLRIFFTPTGVDLKDVQGQMLLELAFGVEKSRIVGAPDWVRSKRYDIDAKVSPEDAPRMAKLKIEQRRTLMLPFMEERFGLKYHHEIREVPVYSLVIAKGGPKLTPSKPGEPGAFLSEARPNGPRRPGTPAPIGEGMQTSLGNIQSRGGEISFLAHTLSGMLGRTVVDRTGLTGNYNFSLKWTPDPGVRTGGGDSEGGAGDDAPDLGGPTLFTALEEQLGLKLESEKRPVDVIVIDHIEQPAKN